MKRKEGAMQTQVGNLQVKIIAENKAVEQKAQDLLMDWEKEKPVRVSFNILTTAPNVIGMCF